jgi:hypothetical protein
LKQIDFTAAIHLTSDELQTRDLTFSAVGSWRSDCRSNPLNAASERGDETSADAHPWGKSRLKPAPDHQVELVDDLARFGQGWYASLDRRDHDGFRFDEQVPPDCHEACSFFADEPAEGFVRRPFQPVVFGSPTR